MDDADNILQARRKARADKQRADIKIRDMHERAIAALLDPVVGASVRQEALRRIDSWERQRLCHQSYVEAWRKLLAMENEQAMRSAVLAEDASAIALRQNTPFGQKALNFGHGQG